MASTYDRRRLWSVVLVLMVGTTTPWARAQYGGGSGTAEAPYQIRTAQDLIDLSDAPKHWDKHFVLVNDIDLDPKLPQGQAFTRAVIAPDASGAEEGHQGAAFTGTLDGQGHAIRNLVVSGQDFVGLFGMVGAGAEVKNVGVADAHVTGTASAAGILAGANYGSIVDCHAAGVIDGDRDTGGLAGSNAGVLVGCHSSALVGGGTCVGGLVGWNDGRLIRCHSANAVTGRENVGGLVGQNDLGSIAHAYSTASVTAREYVGGLVGSNWADVIGSYSSGAVTGGWFIGGFSGLNTGAIINCYGAGPVSGYAYVGGLAGANYSGSVVNSSSSGQVSGDHDAGGLVGDNDDAVAGSFWDTQTSGRSTSDGGTGLTTAQMMSMQTYMDAGWDFAGRSQDGTSQVWQMPSTAGYPVLAIFHDYVPPALQGQGTPQSPYRISDAAELGAVYYYDSHACFQLAAGIDLSGIRWSTAVVPSFAGTFDGTALPITSLTIHGHTGLGLFGQLKAGAQISNIVMSNVSVTGSGACVGALAGENSAGEVVNCQSAGIISGRRYVGGLLGGNTGVVNGSSSAGQVGGDDSVGGLAGYNRGNVDRSFSSAEVTAADDVGGLVGYSIGDVSHCYSSGRVDGQTDVGGLVGDNYANISTCNSTGPVSGADNVGGLIGFNGGSARFSFSAGVVSGDTDVGGLVGDNSGAVIVAHSSGPVSGRENVGGLVGHNSGEEDVSGLSGHHDVYSSVLNSYSTGAVVGDTQVGGLVGNNAGRIVNCYGTGSVAGRWKAIGGLVGYTALPGSVSGSLWDIETSSQSESDGGRGVATSDLQNAGTFLGAGWDFRGEAQNGLHEIWEMPEAGGYPVAAVLNGYEPVLPAGLGTTDIPYRLSTAAELGAAIYLNPRACCELAADVDLAGVTWSTAVLPLFQGVFDGKGFAIRYLTISGTGYLGLFGRCSDRAQISNLAVLDATVIGAAGRVAVLAGHSQESEIVNCRTSGTVSGYDCVGGLIGSSYYGTVAGCNSSGTISGHAFTGGLVGDCISHMIDSSGSGTVCGDDFAGGLAGFNEGASALACYSAGEVTGRTFVGGLVGSNWLGVVTDCYAIGVVIGRDSVGGLAGHNSGAIARCYCAGSVMGDIEVGGLVGSGTSGSIMTSFWDLQSSGRTNMCGLGSSGWGCDDRYGRTTAQMRTAATFLDAGWDFIGETANGSGDLWWILEGIGCPRFLWQIAR